MPFLFGTANREHCLDAVWDMVEHCANPIYGRHVCHYWNGKRLFPIPMNEALVIAREYSAVVRMQWERGIESAAAVTSYVALGM